MFDSSLRKDTNEALVRLRKLLKPLGLADPFMLGLTGDGDHTHALHMSATEDALVTFVHVIEAGVKAGLTPTNDCDDSPPVDPHPARYWVGQFVDKTGVTKLHIVDADSGKPSPQVYWLHDREIVEMLCNEMNERNALREGVTLTDSDPSWVKAAQILGCDPDELEGSALVLDDL